MIFGSDLSSRNVNVHLYGSGFSKGSYNYHLLAQIELSSVLQVFKLSFLTSSCSWSLKYFVLFLGASMFCIGMFAGTFQLV